MNIKSDSRRVKKGDIFVALDGIKSNGDCYIQNAIESGASKIVCKNGKYSVDTINVSDPKKYLTKYLEENYNPYLNKMTMIGITGTNGKTTTAYLTYELLNSMGYKCAYLGTLGFFLDKKQDDLPNTSPDTCTLYELFMDAYNKGYKYIIVEVSSQGLSYNRFDGLKFDYAIFTNLTEDHLDYHKTMQAYAKAKQKLFKYLKEDGVGIINIDDEYHKYFKTKNTVTYGFNKSDYQVIDYKLSINHTDIKIKVKDKIYEYKYPLIGKYNIYNVVAMLSLLDNLGFNIDNIDITKLKTPNGRMDKIKYKDNTIIIDYAHTSDAMDNIYKTVKPLAKGKIITVFGCTGSREKEKRPVMMSLALSNSDYVIVTSDDLHEETYDDIVKDMLNEIKSDKYKLIADRGKAIEEAFKMLDSNDMLLILGKGHEEFIIVGNEKIPFNDKKKVQEILKRESVTE